MAGNGWNVLKYLDMARNGWKCLAGWIGWKCLEMARNGLKWLDMAEMAGNVWLAGLAGNGRKWLETA